MNLLAKGQTMPHYALAVKVAPFLAERLSRHLIITGDAAAFACKLTGELKCAPSWTSGDFGPKDYEMGNNIAALNAILAGRAFRNPASLAPLRLDTSRNVEVP